MAVHFMFAASKQYESVPMDGDSISLGALKDEIARVKFRAALEGKRRMKEAFDFRVYDAETKEEIIGAQTRVRKHSCVLVKRVPAFVVSQHQRHVAAQRHAVPEISRAQENVVDDDFGEDVYSTSSVSDVSSLSSETNCSGNSGTSESSASRSCEEVKKTEVASANKTVMPKVAEDRKVVSAVTENDSSERVGNSDLESAKVPCKVEIPLELTCSLCHDIMKDPVLIPCCCSSFCRNCVTLALVEQATCPICGSSKCRASDLLPNRHVKIILECFLKINGSASNIVSSNASCSSQSLASSISSEHGREKPPHKKTLEKKSSAVSSVSNTHNVNPGLQVARGSNVCGKRKPLVISLTGAKKIKMC